MIEWIKITPETEFPLDEQFLLIDKDTTISLWKRVDSDGCLYGELNDHCCPPKIGRFTHYAIINLPTE